MATLPKASKAVTATLKALPVGAWRPLTVPLLKLPKPDKAAT